MNGRLVILGSKGGPAIRPGGPSPTASLLELGTRRIVVDCGLGVTRGLVEAGIQLRDLDLIFITHLHSDHVIELGPLLHTAWTAGLSRMVRVFGPSGTRRVWAGFLDSLEFDIVTRIDDEGRPNLAGLVEISEFDEGPVVTEGGLSVAALRVAHPPVVDAFALRFDLAGTSVVFSGDTAFFAPLASFATGADILVHEAMLAEGVDRLVARTGNGSRLRQHLLASHSLAEEAGTIASAAGVGRLVLNHFIPADDPGIGLSDWELAVRRSWSGPLTVASDGLVVDITEKTTAEERLEASHPEERHP